MDFKDTVAIVTGGASGLGSATARRLAALGAKVAIFDVNTEAGERTAADIGARFVTVDTTDELSVTAGLQEIEAKLGVGRILVSCAGSVAGARIVGKNGRPHSLDLYRRLIEINLIGTFNVMSKFASRLVLAEAIGEERGVIVNTASIAAYDGQVGGAAYSSAKAGVAGLTLCAARDLAEHRIRVMTIAPGIFQTPMMMSVPLAVHDSLLPEVPHPCRLGDPSEFALLVDSIVRNPMLNGEVIRLDGALRMPPRT